ncbi:hypothetical protein MTP02_58280 [Streptomyces albus]|nr:hypothetical protein MTP02_58280 [Streptomyces albus]
MAAERPGVGALSGPIRNRARTPGLLGGSRAGEAVTCLTGGGRRRETGHRMADSGGWGMADGARQGLWGLRARAPGGGTEAQGRGHGRPLSRSIPALKRRR